MSVVWRRRRLAHSDSTSNVVNSTEQASGLQEPDSNARAAFGQRLAEKCRSNILF